MSLRVDHPRHSLNIEWVVNSPVIAIVIMMACGFTRLPAAETDPPPNIVFILADDMGWPDLACYGHQFHETPVIDSLARQGMKFANFYATPVCSSTRATIQTGQNSARTGITDFIPGHWRPFERLVVPEIDHRLDEGVQTPGDVLKAAGYTTGYFGKWHLGNDDADQPDQHGYDVTDKQLGAEFKEWRATQGRGPKNMDLFTDASLWFLEKHHDQPFFLTVSHQAVHIPVEARPDTIAKYEQKPKPATGVNHPIYAAMTEDLDTSVGRILDKLDELGVSQHTVVVFASDNGGLQTTFTGVGDVVSTNAPLRNEKGTLYEGGIRVPLIFRWPGVVKPGTVSDVVATTADLLPTFAAIGQASLPTQPIDGSSLVPVLAGTTNSLDRDAVYFHYPHYHHSRPAGAIRADDWKLIEFFDDETVELYNLAFDLGETENLAEQRPELVSALRLRLADWRSEVGARMPKLNPDYDPERAHEWRNRRTGKPIDVEAIRKRRDSQVIKSRAK